MNDRHAQFLIAVGDLCLAAGIADLAVRVRVRDGEEGTAQGIPYLRTAGRDGAVEETGYRGTLVVDDHLVDLEEIVECTICAPALRDGD